MNVKITFPRRQLDENETRKYIRQIVSAVEHMHRAKVIHRDIKLQNFMLDQNNDIVIIGNDWFLRTLPQKMTTVFSI